MGLEPLVGTVIFGRRRKGSGHLLAVLAACLAVLSVGYLGFTAYAARMHDEVEARRAETAAFYAAESGLVLAEARLEKGASQRPDPGVWLTGELPGSVARFRVEVVLEEGRTESFTLRSIGQAEGERSRRHTVRFEALVNKVEDEEWSIQWRRRD